MTARDAWAEVDPFDLPEWLGTREVVWSASAGLTGGHRVAGELRATADSGETAAAQPVAPVVCDLFAVDEAYPAPVSTDDLRRCAHQAWRRGEVYLVECGGRLALAVPGTGFDPARVLDAVGRLARAVGAAPSAYAVLLRVG